MSECGIKEGSTDKGTSTCNAVCFKQPENILGGGGANTLATREYLGGGGGGGGAMMLL